MRISSFFTALKVVLLGHFLVVQEPFPGYFYTTYGEVPEWLKGPAWKAGIGVTLSRVRIPSSPLKALKTSVLRWFFYDLTRTKLDACMFVILALMNNVYCAGFRERTAYSFRFNGVVIHPRSDIGIL